MFALTLLSNSADEWRLLISALYVIGSAAVGYSLWAVLVLGSELRSHAQLKRLEESRLRDVPRLFPGPRVPPWRRTKRRETKEERERYGYGAQRVWAKKLWLLAYDWEHDPRSYAESRREWDAAALHRLDEEWEEAWSAASHEELVEKEDELRVSIQRWGNSPAFDREYFDDNVYWRAGIGLLGIAFDIAATFVWLWGPV
jgi:hypothetical protein